MKKEQQKDEIILTVKKAINDFSDIDIDLDYVQTSAAEIDLAAEQIAETLYNAGYRKTFTSDIASDTQKAFKDGYIKGSIDQTYEAYEKGKKDTAEKLLNLAQYEDKLQNGELVSKDWHDEQVMLIKGELDQTHENYVAILKHNAFLRNELRESKAEAVKEFAAKLIKPLFNGRDSVDYKQALISVCDIDEALKEYTK